MKSLKPNLSLLICFNTTFCLGSIKVIIWAKYHYDMFQYNILFRFNVLIQLKIILMIFCFNTTFCLGSMRANISPAFQKLLFQYNILFRFNLIFVESFSIYPCFNTTFCLGSITKGQRGANMYI